MPNSFLSKIDLGRLISVPLFTLLMAVNLLGIQGEIKAPEPSSALKAAKLMHHGLVFCFYLLVVVLYFIRNSAKSTSKSFLSKVIAIVASFMPFALPFFLKPSQDLAIVLLSNVITIAGMVVAVYSLFVLGRSFSIIPQARSIVQNGPYRIVRHPLYAGELISMLGIVLAGFTISALSVLGFIALLQLYRALEEEKVLAAAFPEYESYFMKKPRFIPGLF